MKALLTLLCVLTIPLGASAQAIPPKGETQAALMAVCLTSPGNSERSCACGVDHSARSLDAEQLAILAFMAAEMQKLDADEELFLAIIRRFRLSPERFRAAMAAINRVSAEANELCERPPLQPAAE